MTKLSKEQAIRLFEIAGYEKSGQSKTGRQRMQQQMEEGRIARLTTYEKGTHFYQAQENTPLSTTVGYVSKNDKDELRKMLSRLENPELHYYHVGLGAAALVVSAVNQLQALAIFHRVIGRLRIDLRSHTDELKMYDIFKVKQAEYFLREDSEASVFLQIDEPERVGMILSFPDRRLMLDDLTNDALTSCHYLSSELSLDAVWRTSE